LESRAGAIFARRTGRCLSLRFDGGRLPGAAGD
jgi:hypothetical protein